MKISKEKLTEIILECYQEVLNEKADPKDEGMKDAPENLRKDNVATFYDKQEPKISLKDPQEKKSNKNIKSSGDLKPATKGVVGSRGGKNVPTGMYVTDEYTQRLYESTMQQVKKMYNSMTRSDKKDWWAASGLKSKFDDIKKWDELSKEEQKELRSGYDIFKNDLKKEPIDEIINRYVKKNLTEADDEPEDSGAAPKKKKKVEKTVEDPQDSTDKDTDSEVKEPAPVDDPAAEEKPKIKKKPESKPEEPKANLEDLKEPEKKEGAGKVKFKSEMVHEGYKSALLRTIPESFLKDVQLELEKKDIKQSSYKRLIEYAIIGFYSVNGNLVDKDVLQNIIKSCRKKYPDPMGFLTFEFKS